LVAQTPMLYYYICFLKQYLGGTVSICHIKIGYEWNKNNSNNIVIFFYLKCCQWGSDLRPHVYYLNIINNLICWSPIDTRYPIYEFIYKRKKKDTHFVPKEKLKKK
jgi:hypothetical protein